MSPAAIDDSHPADISASIKTGKKLKRERSEHKKKRAREEDAAAIDKTPRKSRKTKTEKQETDDEVSQSQLKSETPTKKSKRSRGHEDFHDEEAQPAATPVNGSKKSRKSKKHTLLKQEDDDMEIDLPEEPIAEEPGSKREKKAKKSKLEEHAQDLESEAPTKSGKKKDKSKGKEKSREKKKRLAAPEISDDDAIMDLDQPRLASKSKSPESGSAYPFFTQTVSLFVPFFPVGLDKPLTNVAAQHLDPLLNQYSPTFRGVLLSYSNLNLSEKPAKASIRYPPTDETPALLHSVDEYAVCFGWLTLEAQLFVPGRGKWMEGVLQLQSEGHIGVVCWNKFNASIEAKRLPKGWKWVELHEPASAHKDVDMFRDGDVAEKQEDRDAFGGKDLQVVEQMHTTGYWVDEHNRKVTGKLRFRIKNYDVGLAGEYGYMSIEGTFLDDDAERTLAAEEREMEKRRRLRQNSSGLLRPLARRVPEFSMTKLGREEEEEDSGKRTILYKGSQPGTPDD
ncbi:hypothetical protein B0H67DRAFT_486033 [Lasiosphaeris hirsuta]|uniref:DNA-directed RNA polymerase subunit n=1 Tax=Lasiosphaeris hirsuta TaxID=260670 RepID=A0AA40DZ93_9PEZI|nr:hypothetical protein B0H67DRAFT_486033 [Lasiosphaeris hirsuta]